MGAMCRCDGAIGRCDGCVAGSNNRLRVRWYNGASVRGATVYNVGVVMVRCSRSGMGKLPNDFCVVFSV